MRKQIRPDEPQEFVENAEKWNNQWSRKREQNAASSFSWYQINGKTAREIALPILVEMNQGHCSFCDCYPLQDRSAEPIEHFRPKSKPEFYHLAFAWDNLYYCCDYCQKAKREAWDDNLLKPDVPDYEFLRYFEFDFTTGELRPSLTADSADQERARTTINIYGLDSSAKRRQRMECLTNFRDDHPIDTMAYRDYLEGGSAW